MEWIEEIPKIKKFSKISCSSSSCKQNLHCFRKFRPKKNQTYRSEICNNCESDLINWLRIDKLDITDFDYLKTSLNYEYLRHFYWERELPEDIINKAMRTSKEEMKEKATKIFEKKIKAVSSEHFRDGTQTPLEGDLVFFAQHATATCCRKCIEQWYSIDREIKLNDEQVDFFIKVIMKYVYEKIDDSTEKIQNDDLM